METEFRIDNEQGTKVAALLGTLAGNLCIPVSLRGAEQTLGINLGRFIERFSIYDLGGLRLACCEKTKKEDISECKGKLISEYRPILSTGLRIRLRYLDRYGGRLDVERDVAELLEDQISLEEVKK